MCETFPPNQREACDIPRASIKVGAENRLQYTYYHCTKKRGPCSQGGIEESALTAQILECLSNLRIPAEFHTWALKWLEHENAKEVETRESVRLARQKAYDQAVRMFDRYTDMRAREELTEEEFRVKKALALKEKARP